MKVIAVNGSPRKGWNTATLLEKALEGAESQGAKTKLIHLYDLDYKGCISCFACKRKGGKSYGKCAVKDDLQPVLEKIEAADAVILGSPIYFSALSGEMRSFLERLMFQYLVYDKEHSTLFPKKINVGLICTMNVPAEFFDKTGYGENLKGTERTLQRIFGAAESIYATDTYQFSDYSKYESSGFDERAKAAWRKEQFPIDCQKAYEMGARFAGGK